MLRRTQNFPSPLRASPNKIVFIGPPGSAMRSLGDKISSTIVAQHAKVPCIPWSGEGVDEVKIDEDGIVTVADEVYSRGCTHSWEEGLERARTIGFPVMVKASEAVAVREFAEWMARKSSRSCIRMPRAKSPDLPCLS